MKLSSPILLAILPAVVNAAGGVTSLTPENYHTLTAGKAVFIKFFAPWCGHCKAMASDFENLATAHETDSSKLIAEVDCTAESSQALCQEHGVEGFPTLKHGNPNSLSDYQGGRDFDSMNAFVNNDLKISCSPFNLELCDGDEKKVIEDIMKMDDAALAEEIAKVDAVMKEADAELEKGIEGLQSKFEDMMEKHESEMEKVKEEADYKLMKSVLKLKKAEAGITEDDDDVGAFGKDDDDDDDDDDDE